MRAREAREHAIKSVSSCVPQGPEEALLFISLYNLWFNEPKSMHEHMAALIA